MASQENNLYIYNTLKNIFFKQCPFCEVFYEDFYSDKIQLGINITKELLKTLSTNNSASHKGQDPQFNFKLACLLSNIDR